MSEVESVALVHRYLSEVIHSRRFEVLSEILVPGYGFETGGTSLVGRDDHYIPMVSAYLAGEPTIDTAVHDIVTDGRYAAVWLTKHTVNPRAAWDAVLIYRSSGDQLDWCWSEQDWAARRRQLKGEQTPPRAPVSAHGVWDVPALRADPETEMVAAAWLAGRPCDMGISRGATPGPVLDVESVDVNCLFTAGDRFGFHLTQHGTYLDGLTGCAGHRGKPAQLHLAGIGTVTGRAVSCARVVTDSSELGRRLAAPASLTGQTSNS
jgi:hypothetical protein